MADFTQCLDHCMKQGGSKPFPTKLPALHSVNQIVQIAREIVDESPGLQAWMQDSGLDPADGRDGLLAIGVAVAVSKEDPVYDVVSV